MKFLSIITPTYNRAKELKVCYETLVKQPNQDFEWIIVDDGSTDETFDLVASWIKQNSITIKYFKQKNLGRYMALNKGVEEADGYLSMYMDSDDWFVDDAIQTIKESWESLSEELQEKLCGLSFLCYDDFGNLIGDYYPKDNYVSNFFDIRMIDNIKGDKKELVKTEILKQFTFPYFEGQKRMPTTYVLYGISKKYPAIFINKVVIYKQYIQTGWSKNIDKVRMNNAITSKEYYKYIINLYYPFKYIKALGFFTNYFRYSFHTHTSLNEAISKVKLSVLLPTGLILGYVLYLKDRRRFREKC